MTYHPTNGWLGTTVAFFTDPIVDIISGGSGSTPSSDTCLQQQSNTTAKLDAMTNDLAANWKPTGFYRLEDLSKMRDEVFKIMTAATAAIERAIADGVLVDMRSVLRAKQRDVQGKMADSLLFTNAIHTARTNGIKVIDAPSFKRWVIESLNKASNATGAAAYMACIKPALVAAVQAIVAAWAVVVRIGKAMVRATIAIGEQILKLPDTLATVWKYTTWGGLAFLAYYAFKPKRPNPACRKRRR